MKLSGVLNRFIATGRFSRAIIGAIGAALFLASGLATWLLIVFRGFVVSVRSSYEPLPVFLQTPVFVVLLLFVGLLALAGAYLIIISFRPQPSNNSFKPNRIRGST